MKAEIVAMKLCGECFHLFRYTEQKETCCGYSLINLTKEQLEQFLKEHPEIREEQKKCIA